MDFDLYRIPEMEEIESAIADAEYDENDIGYTEEL